ncbi:MAG: hypothetical protein KAQ62_11955, partial [Cyclobacteriaceae bacterium]|nr:hypothetical protein [Cyclobacteriaceae bacterium]
VYIFGIIFFFFCFLFDLYPLEQKLKMYMREVLSAKFCVIFLGSIFPDALMHTHFSLILVTN